MKKITMVLFLALICLGINAQTGNSSYNKKLADSLGADEYGMKSYILVILKTGMNKTQDKDELNRLYQGHFENINRLADMGKLVVAGPFGENENNFRGIFILSVKTIDEAKLLLESDPTIKEGIFEVEMYNWYGSAALPVYLDVHKQIEKTQL
jgi:uncharacterized protein YciI